MVVVGSIVRVSRVLGIVDDGVVDGFDQLIAGGTGHLADHVVHLGQGILDCGGVDGGGGGAVRAGCAIARCRTRIEDQRVMIAGNHHVLQGWVEPENLRMLVKDHLQGGLEGGVDLILTVTADVNGDSAVRRSQSAEEGIVHPQRKGIVFQIRLAQVIGLRRTGGGGSRAAGSGLGGVGGRCHLARFSQRRRAADRHAEHHGHGKNCRKDFLDHKFLLLNEICRFPFSKTSVVFIIQHRPGGVKPFFVKFLFLSDSPFVPAGKLLFPHGSAVHVNFPPSPASRQPRSTNR